MTNNKTFHFFWYGPWELFAMNGKITLHHLLDYEYKFDDEFETIGL